MVYIDGLVACVHRVLGATAFFLLAFSFPIAAQFGSRSVLNPRTYTSPSGQWELDVDPSAPDGAGAAHYVLRLGDNERWSGDLDFTFVKAIITDGGVTGGFGYSKGWESWEGALVIATISETGELVFLDELPREGPRFFDTPPVPIGIDVLYHSSLGKMVVRIADPDINRQSEEWRVFAVPPGERLGVFRPRGFQPSRDYLRGATSVALLPGTPLVLVEWWRCEFGRSAQDTRLGPRFALVDLDGQPVWTEELPSDYAADDRDLVDHFQTEGAVLSVTTPGHFTVGHVAAEEAVTYAAKSDDGKTWKVSEVAREPWSLDAEQCR